MSPDPSVEEFCAGVRAGERRTVAKTITLLESRRADHRELGQQVLENLIPHTGGALRIGISGPPGVGKSSFIETFGLELVRQDKRLAVLAVDPSSPVSGGSILGDKTRMEQLAREEAAFIRPSPSGGELGGVAHRTREAMLVCEAAGYDVVIVETVGVGQSEVEVRSMVDFFAVLLQPGAGDELQGIKKGVLELADALLVNKADGDTKLAAERTARDYDRALSLLRPPTGWRVPVFAVSAVSGTGIPRFWEIVLEHREITRRSGEFEARRRSQSKAWMWKLLDEGLRSAFHEDSGVAELLPRLESEVQAKLASAPRAARILLDAFLRSRTKD